MARKRAKSSSAKVPKVSQSKRKRSAGDSKAVVHPEIHVYGADSRVCLTNSKGRATPKNRSRAELVVDTHRGFVPLWSQGVTLRWRINEPSVDLVEDSNRKRRSIRELFGEALLRWGDATPVAFQEDDDNWDFEFVLSPADNCFGNACTLARAFFPDSGRHDLLLYPRLFDEPIEEQIETFMHELGHVFGLRHFFANVDETEFPSAIFGTHRRFTIMNYGEESVFTEYDKADLATLYSRVWSGDLIQIGGTPIVQFRPFHEFQNALREPDSAFESGQTRLGGMQKTDHAIRDLLIQLLRER